MPSAVTAYGASYFLDVLFGQIQDPPPYYYVALCTQPPGTQADGTQLTEPDIDAGYYRAFINNDASSWGVALDGITASIAQLVYPVATADWPTITHYALCDSLVGGQVYLYGNFTTPRRVRSGDQARIGAQSLSLSIATLPTGVSSTF